MGIQSRELFAPFRSVELRTPESQLGLESGIALCFNESLAITVNRASDPANKINDNENHDSKVSGDVPRFRASNPSR